MLSQVMENSAALVKLIAQLEADLLHWPLGPKKVCCRVLDWYLLRQGFTWPRGPGRGYGRPHFPRVC